MTKNATVKTVDAGRDPAARHDYFAEVAEARYVLRRVFRISEEQARAAGLDPLAHQALIQIYGSPERRLRVNQLAERLDITPAFASSLLKSLVARQRPQARPGDAEILCRAGVGVPPYCHVDLYFYMPVTPGESRGPVAATRA